MERQKYQYKCPSTPYAYGIVMVLWYNAITAISVPISSTLRRLSTRSFGTQAWTPNCAMDRRNGTEKTAANSCK